MRQVIKYFALDLTAGKTAEVVALTRRSVSRARIFVKIRARIAEECQRASPFGGTVEVDESYFGARRVRGQRGRGAAGKTIVSGIFKRNGAVDTELVPDCKARTLQQIIGGRVAAPDTIIHCDGWRGSDGLVDVGYWKHFRVCHALNQFADGTNDINATSKVFGLRRNGGCPNSGGVARKTFYLHLKECEYRFNNRKQNLFRLLFKLLENYPL